MKQTRYFFAIFFAVSALATYKGEENPGNLQEREQSNDGASSSAPQATEHDSQFTLIVTDCTSPSNPKQKITAKKKSCLLPTMLMCNAAKDTCCMIHDLKAMSHVTIESTIQPEYVLQNQSSTESGTENCCSISHQKTVNPPASTKRGKTKKKTVCPGKRKLKENPQRGSKKKHFKPE